jgi:hypothetical protein
MRRERPGGRADAEVRTHEAHDAVGLGAVVRHWL